MRNLFLLAFACFLFSCTGNSTEETVVTTKNERDSIPSNTSENNITGCYLRVMQKDSLLASLSQNGNTVTGKLVFDNYEKDGSKGTVSGKVDGDVLKLVYRFQSEGMNSISEQYFKITKDGLLQGNGPIEVKGDSAYYSNPADIKYDEKNVLNKIDCDKVKL